jgi:transposase
MTTQVRYTDEFKEEAVKQVTERGYPVKDVAERLGVHPLTLYRWLGGNGTGRNRRVEQEILTENAKLKAELKRVQEERDILKKAAAYFAKASG